MTAPVGQGIVVYYADYDENDGNDSHWALTDISPLLVAPAPPQEWSATSSYTSWRAVPRTAGSVRLSFDATVLDFHLNGSAPTTPGPQHHRRGTSTIALRFDPRATGITSARIADVIDPAAQPRPGDAPALPAGGDISGVWCTPQGRDVDILSEGGAVTISFVPSGSEPTSSFAGTTNGDLALDGRLLASHGLGLDPGLIGQQLHFTGTVPPDGLTIEALLTPTGAPPQNGIPLTLRRKPIVTSVSVVCTSLRDLVSAVDGRRPWDDQRLTPSLERFTSRRDDDDIHLLLLVGGFFPREEINLGPPALATPLDPDLFRSEDQKLVYYPLRRWDTRETESLSGELLAKEVREAAFETGWGDLEVAVGARAAAQMKANYDALLVAVVPEPGALPGRKVFHFAGSRVEWQMDSPTTVGTLDVVRNVVWSDVYLPIEEITRNSEVYIQLSVPTGFTPNKVAVSVRQNDGTKLSDVELTTVDQDSSSQPSGKFLRSQKLMFVYAGEGPSVLDGAATIATDAGGIQVTFDTPLVRLASPVVEAKLLSNPVTTYAYFPTYLSAAAAASDAVPDADEIVETFHSLVIFNEIGVSVLPAGFPLAPDFAYVPLSRGYSDIDLKVSIPLGVPWLPHITITPGIRTTNVRLGDHAAALLLKAQFSRQLAAARDNLNSVLSQPGGVASMLRLRYWDIVRGVDLLSKIKVTTPGGTEVELAAALTPLALRRDYPNRPAASGASLAMTTAAVRKLLEAVEGSLTTALQIEDDEIEDLLKLTGRGFEAVVSRSTALVLRRVDFSSQPGDYHYVTDEVAVRWLGNVSYTAELMQANAELASADTAVLLAVASALPVFLPVGLARALIGAGLGIFDLVDLGVDYYGQQRERAFAFGATPVIGRDRLAEAEAKELPLWAVLLGAGLGVLGGIGDAAEVFGQVSVALARSRAARLLSSIEDGGIAALRSMGLEDRRSVLVAIFDARLTAQSIEGPIDPRLRRLLAVADELEAEAMAAARAARRTAFAQSSDAVLALELPPALRSEVPVITDTRLPAALPGEPATVKLAYDVDADGFVSNLRMLAAPGASAADIRSHISTAERMFEYGAKAQAARSVLERLKRWVRQFGERRPGTLAWEANLEVEKLVSVLIEDRFVRLASGELNPLSPVVQADIGWIGERIARFSRVADSMDRNPGAGFVAATTAAASAPIGSGLYYRPVDAGVQGLRALDLERRIQELSMAVTTPQLVTTFRTHVLDDLRRGVLPNPEVLTGQVVDRVRNLAKDDDLYELLMSTPGFSSTAADLVRGANKAQGAEWIIQFNKLLKDGRLPDEVMELLGDGTGTRLFEDLVAGTPRFASHSELVLDGLQRRGIYQGMDQVLDSGMLLEFKSYSNWWAVRAKIESQCIGQLARYADAGWADLSNGALSGQLVYLINGRTLTERPALSAIGDVTSDLGNAITDSFSTVFRVPDPLGGGGLAPVDVHVFVIDW